MPLDIGLDIGLDIEKVGSTAIVWGLCNLLVSPIYYYSGTDVGLASFIILNTLLIHKMHNIGKKENKISNFKHNISNFFSPVAGEKSSDVYQAIKNTVHGGDIIFDKCSDEITAFCKKSVTP